MSLTAVCQLPLLAGPVYLILNFVNGSSALLSPYKAAKFAAFCFDVYLFPYISLFGRYVHDWLGCVYARDLCVCLHSIACMHVPASTVDCHREGAEHPVAAGVSPLSMAIQGGSRNIVLTLLELNADLNAQIKTPQVLSRHSTSHSCLSVPALW